MPAKAALTFSALPTVEDARLISFRAFPEPNGTLVPLNVGAEIPFPANRIFYVYGTGKGDVRGEHAHRECHQLLVAVHGTMQITVDDGERTKSVSLDSPAKGLWIPPGIWATQSYLADRTVLLVVCDQPFLEEDYVRDYNAFLELREAGFRKAR